MDYKLQMCSKKATRNAQVRKAVHSELQTSTDKVITWSVKMFVRDSIGPGIDPTKINRKYYNIILPQVVNIVGQVF